MEAEKIRMRMSPIACWDAERDPEKEATVLQWRAHQLAAEEQGKRACHCASCREA